MPNFASVPLMEAVQSEENSKIGYQDFRVSGL
jgi:hypothetical protein